MRIGSLTIPTPLFLSPLAGYTNLPFRLVVREVGGVGLCTTDLVNARSLLEKNPKAFKLIETNAADTPLAVQLFGSVPEEMRDAAQFLESLGVASVDINMGCPVKKVVKIGGGSAMMTELDKTSALVKGMVNAVKIPITAKPTNHSDAVCPLTKISSNIGCIIAANSPKVPPSTAISTSASASIRQCTAR